MIEILLSGILTSIIGFFVGLFTFWYKRHLEEKDVLFLLWYFWDKKQEDDQEMLNFFLDTKKRKKIQEMDKNFNSRKSIRHRKKNGKKFRKMYARYVVTMSRLGLHPQKDRL